METKRTGGGGDSPGPCKKTKREYVPSHTKTFYDEFWKGCILDIYQPYRVMTFMPGGVTAPNPNPPLINTTLSKSDKKFSGGGAKFMFTELGYVNCHLHVASKCFGDDYAGIPHLLEHVLVSALGAKLIAIPVKGITRADTTSYTFKLDQSSVFTKIPDIVNTLTNVTDFDDLVKIHMPNEVHRVHNEFLEKLFFIHKKFYFGYLLGNKAHAHAGLHRNFCGLCNKDKESKDLYKDTEQKLKKLFKQVYIPENMYLLLEVLCKIQLTTKLKATAYIKWESRGKERSLVKIAKDNFIESFGKVESREEEEGMTIKELEYSLSGKWLKTTAAVIQSYRELNLAWTIGGTDPIPYEFLATLLSCSLVNGGLVGVLKSKCETTVYKVDSATIKHTSAVSRHFVLTILLHKGVDDEDVIEVTCAVVEFLKGLKKWIADPVNLTAFEAQFENFRLLMAVNKVFHDAQLDEYKKKKPNEELNSVVPNFIYDSKNSSGNALNIDTLAWQLAVPESKDSSKRLGQILDVEFLITSKMAIIDIEVGKDEFRRLSLEDLYLDNVAPTEETFKNNEMGKRLRLLDSKTIQDVKIDFDADYIRNLEQTIIAEISQDPDEKNLFPEKLLYPLNDPCIRIELYLQWCPVLIPYDSAMPGMLIHYLSYGYRESYYSAWMEFSSTGVGDLTVIIFGLQKPATDLLKMQVLERLKHLRNNTNISIPVLDSTFLHVYKTVTKKMCLPLRFSENLMKGMMTKDTHVYQDRLVGLNSLSGNKDIFYTYFQEVLQTKLHSAKFTANGNVFPIEVAELHTVLRGDCLGSKCICTAVTLPFNETRTEICLNNIRLPDQKEAVVVRKHNYLYDSPLQCFHRVYYLDNPILNTNVVLQRFIGRFLKECREQRLYKPSVKYVADKKLLIFEIPFCIDVFKGKDSTSKSFLNMKTIRNFVEKSVEQAVLHTKVLQNLKARLTIETYERKTYAKASATQGNPYVIEWYREIDTSVAALKDFFASAHAHT